MSVKGEVLLKCCVCGKMFKPSRQQFSRFKKGGRVICKDKECRHFVSTTARWEYKNEEVPCAYCGEKFLPTLEQVKQHCLGAPVCCQNKECVKKEKEVLAAKRRKVCVSSSAGSKEVSVRCPWDTGALKRDIIYCPFGG